MIKKLFTLLFTMVVLTGCETINAVIQDAQELETSVVEKITEIKTGIDSLVGEAQDTYENLLAKKAELEKMIIEINEAVDSISQLLGKDEVESNEVENLQKTIADLQATLSVVESTLDEIEKVEENFETVENSGEETAETEIE